VSVCVGDRGGGRGKKSFGGDGRNLLTLPETVDSISPSATQRKGENKWT